jgi:hypothetical protein
VERKLSVYSVYYAMEFQCSDTVALVVARLKYAMARKDTELMSVQYNKLCIVVLFFDSLTIFVRKSVNVTGEYFVKCLHIPLWNSLVINFKM